MKTKIVYVVVSDNNDYYIEQALISVFSLKMHNPNAFVEFAVDEGTNDYLKAVYSNAFQYVDLITPIKTPSGLNKKRRSRYLKTNLRSFISGDYLFLDTDTIITGKLDFVDDYNFDVGAILDKHIPISQHPFRKAILDTAHKLDWTIPDNGYYFNSGVMYVKDTEASRNLYDRWYYFWTSSVDKWGFDIDQPALAKANSECGYIIQKIDDRLNCQLMENGLLYFNDALIIHYFASNIGMEWDSAYNFRNIEIYKALRDECLSQSLKSQILNAKSAFHNKCLIIAGNQYDNYNSIIVRYAVKFSQKYPKINQIIDKLSSWIRKLI